MQTPVGGIYNVVSQHTNTETGPGSALVRIMDSERYPIIQSGEARFGEVFDARTGSLEHRRDIPPKGWYQVQFNNADTSKVYFISLIGWREENLLS
jgi:hypothetical protein